MADVRVKRGELTMSEGNDGSLGTRDIDRRTFLVAGTSMAASVALPGTAVANATGDGPDEAPGVLVATVASEPSPTAMDVIRLDCNCPSRLVQSPNATPAHDGAFVRFRPGDGVLVFGDSTGDRTIAADQVVPLVFGDESDSWQRSA